MISAAIMHVKLWALAGYTKSSLNLNIYQSSWQIHFSYWKNHQRINNGRLRFCFSQIDWVSFILSYTHSWLNAIIVKCKHKQHPKIIFYENILMIWKKSLDTIESVIVNLDIRWRKQSDRTIYAEH